MPIRRDLFLPRPLRTRTAAALFSALVVIALCSTSARAVVIGQKDDFQDGTNQNWFNGSQAADPQILSGGMGGAGDIYMRVNADGGGSGGKLTIFNVNQWTGDYLAASVSSIGIDLRNFSSQTLSMRIAFKDSTGNGSPGFCTTTPFSLVNDGLWHHAVFTISAATMTHVGSGGLDFNTLMHGPSELRLLHATSPSVTGSNIVGAFGFDNVTALPAPGAAALFTLAATALLLRRR